MLLVNVTDSEVCVYLFPIFAIAQRLYKALSLCDILQNTTQYINYHTLAYIVQCIAPPKTVLATCL